MIFGSENISTYTKNNMIVWFALALQAGLLNIGGLMACRTFVSHVTGFASLAGYEAGMGDLTHSFSLLIVPLFFLMGSMLSAVLVDLRMKLGKKPKYYVVFGVLFFLSLATTVGGFNGAFGEFGQALSDIRGYTLVALLCFTCGMQNGMVALVSKSVVRTTHLTGITTDLGIGLIRIFNRHRISNIEGEGIANLMRTGIILSFTLGSFIGVFIFRTMRFRGFVIPCLVSAILFGFALYFQVFRKQKTRN